MGTHNPALKRTAEDADGIHRERCSKLPLQGHQWRGKTAVSRHQSSFKQTNVQTRNGASMKLVERSVSYCVNPTVKRGGSQRKSGTSWSSVAALLVSSIHWQDQAQKHLHLDIHTLTGNYA